MDYKDYYKTLGVKRNASQDEIRRAYRTLSRKFHPDVSKEDNAEQKFKEVGEAYEVLKDPEKRAAYDQLGKGWQEGQQFRPPPDWQEGFSFRGGGYTTADADGFSDFFASLFGERFSSQTSSGFSGRNVHRKGEDIHARIEISLEDSFRGATRSIRFEVPELTDDGRIQNRQKELQVRIPKGIAEGQQIRLQGQGSKSVGQGTAGDLYLEISFKPHPYYRPDGKDLYLKLPVAPWEAALGAKVKVPTPGGVVDLQIPKGSTNGQKMRLQGRGLPGKPQGHLYVVLDIVLPPAESERAKDLYRTMETDLAFNPRSALGV